MTADAPPPRREPINARWELVDGVYVALGQPRRSLWHWLQGCRGRIESDQSGLWFECATCHRVSGFASYDQPSITRTVTDGRGRQQ